MSNKFFVFLVYGFLVLTSAISADAQVKVIKGEYLLRSSSSELGTLSQSPVELFKKHDSELGISSVEPEVVDFDTEDSTCSNLILSGQASFCEPNYYVEASAVSNDPLSSQLYGLSLMGAQKAWDRSTGSSNVVVAIIDTGVDYNHPDLAANIWTNPGEIAGNGIDDDGNGWIDDVHGINAYAGSGNPLDDNGHGTHVSGTIGATGNNSLGVVGVNWNVRIMGLKFLGSGGGGSIFGAIQAINYMIDAKNRYGLNLKVANNSWGGAGYSKALEDAISKANDAGIIFVAAAGNESTNNDILPSYPANYNLPNVVSVAAIDSAQSLAFFSNYGSIVDIAAPGVAILSTLPNSNYGSLSGTSMATPHVSGALALLAAYDSSLSINSMIDRLYSTATPVAGLSGKIRTGAMLNVAGMLGAPSTPVVEPQPIGSVVSRLSLRTGDGSVAINPGDALKISVTSRADVNEVAMEIFLNNKKCQQAKVVSLSSGVNKFQAKVGSLAEGIKNLSIQVGDRKARKNISVRRSTRSVSTKKVSSRSLNVTCSRIAKTIR